MIRARRLFAVPAISALFLIPLFPVGLLAWIGIVGLWYYWNEKEVNAFICGYTYIKDEYADLESLK